MKNDNIPLTKKTGQPKKHNYPATRKPAGGFFCMADRLITDTDGISAVLPPLTKLIKHGKATFVEWV
ncbi:MAG: hypothetical protein WC404_06235 [Candidatus Omnitrophota bacterium]|jgi:hypothetical protein